MEPLSRDELKSLIEEAQAQAQAFDKAEQDSSFLRRRIERLRKIEQSAIFVEKAKPSGDMESKEVEGGEDIIISTGPVRWGDFEE